MDLETIETRMNEITSLLDSPESNLEDLEKEIRSLKEQKRQILEDIEKRKAEEREVIESAKVVDEFKERKQKMELRELLKTDAYIDAFAQYIKTGSTKAVRKLMTENALEANIEEGDGLVPVPTYLADRINTAWERNELIRRIPKTYFKGNYKEAFELSATDAVVHEEGADAPAEEQVQFGIVEIVNKNLKKWLKITDELLSLRGQLFLDYVFDEIEYRISKLATSLLLNAIATAPAQDSATAIGVPVLSIESLDVNTILNASALLAEDATPIVITDRANYALIKGMTNEVGDRVNADPFNGYEVVFATMPTVTGATIPAILLDPRGAVVNLPDGDNVTIKVDDLSLAEYDLVKVVGKQMMGIGLTKPKHAVVISIASE